MQLDPSYYFTVYGPRYFPWVVLACATLENDVTFIMAGVYASSVKTHLHLTVAVGMGVIGALCHDSFWYTIGRNRSEWLKKTSAWKRLGLQVEAWSARFGVRELFFCRFMPGTRNVSVLFWGIQRLPIPIFLAIEAVALTIWGGLLVRIGYLLGSQAQVLLWKVKQKHLGRWMLLTLIVTLIVYIAIRAFTKHEIVKHGKPPYDPRAD